MAIAHPLQALLNFYEVIFGLTLCIIDGPEDRFPSFRAGLFRYVSFLHSNVSRTFFYLFIACLEGTQDSWYRQGVGWFFLIIGALHGAQHCMSRRSLPAADVQM